MPAHALQGRVQEYISLNVYLFPALRPRLFIQFVLSPSGQRLYIQRASQPPSTAIV